MDKSLNKRDIELLSSLGYEDFKNVKTYDEFLKIWKESKNGDALYRICCDLIKTNKNKIHKLFMCSASISNRVIDYINECYSNKYYRSNFLHKYLEDCEKFYCGRIDDKTMYARLMLTRRNIANDLELNKNNKKKYAALSVCSKYDDNRQFIPSLDIVKNMTYLANEMIEDANSLMQMNRYIIASSANICREYMDDFVEHYIQKNNK